ncbi:MAG: hypothetical protein IM638_11745 [Bacteroidetes bacterium]|nr:hypothetical protein [Bacteroidota bacterium]
MTRIPIPKPCFLDKCEFIGVFDGKKRWRSKDFSKLYTWDALHGEIEVFNKRGKHIAVLNSMGDLIKPAVKGRTINV